MLETIRCIVAAVDSNGSPDFYFVKVSATQEQYDNGDHYDRAKEAAEDNGYEPRLAYDEHDAAGRAMLAQFEWDTASTVTVGEEGEVAPEPKQRVASDLFRTVVQVEVLSNGPYEMLSLEGLAHDITDGECSGDVKVVSEEEVSRDRMTELLEAQGSSPEFLLGDEEEAVAPCELVLRDYSVRVVRTDFRAETFTVKGLSASDAGFRALEAAADHDFSLNGFLEPETKVDDVSLA
jgi:hypothetical protein